MSLSLELPLILARLGALHTSSLLPSKFLWIDLFFSSEWNSIGPLELMGVKPVISGPCAIELYNMFSVDVKNEQTSIHTCRYSSRMPADDSANDDSLRRFQDTRKLCKLIQGDECT